MKVLQGNHNGIEGMKIVEVPEPPAPRHGEVLVRPRAFSLNYRDLMVAEGKYGKPPAEPQIVGSDMTGEVVAVGPGVDDVKPGDRVVNAPITGWLAGRMRRQDASTFLGAGGVPGVFAERVLLPAHALVKISHLSDPEAATLTIAGLTAWAAVVTHGRVEPGSWVLCPGTGGVSIFGAQIAIAAGANVILTSSSDEKLADMKRRLGDRVQTLNYRKDEQWEKRVRDITGDRLCDIVVETVGGSHLDRSADCVNHGGRICVIGVLQGLDGQINVGKLLSRQLHIIGIYMESIAEFRKYVAWADTLTAPRPIIDREFDFADYRKAYERLKSGQHVGKIVVRGV